MKYEDWWFLNRAFKLFPRLRFEWSEEVKDAWFKAFDSLADRVKR